VTLTLFFCYIEPMMYNAGWANLKPQELKYTAKLGNDAAQLLEAGESLSAVARKLKVSRPSLRNWRSRNPKLNAAFATFEAGKLKQEAERARVRHFKKVASGMVEAAREGASDPIQMALKSDEKASEPEEVPKPINPEEAWKRSALAFFNSDWGPLIEAQEAQAQEEADAAEREKRSGLWCG
jgi:transposase-like protein